MSKNLAEMTEWMAASLASRGGSDVGTGADRKIAEGMTAVVLQRELSWGINLEVLWKLQGPEERAAMSSIIYRNGLKQFEKST